MDSVFGVCVSGGVEIKGLAATLGPRRIFQHSPPLLEEYHFVPFMENK